MQRGEPAPEFSADASSCSPAREVAMSLTLVSPAFPPNGEIPAAHTCDGANMSPALEWSGAPAGTRSLALIVDDPDAPDPRAPTRTYVHWVLYDIPPSVTGLPAARPAAGDSRDGLNDWKQRGYGGPCPPVGRHRYFFKLHALDTMLGDLHAPTKDGLEQAMRGHVLERAELVGTYERTTAARA
jgi:Raf kinase inhibitor-like YbhB/YbcL family protein